MAVRFIECNGSEYPMGVLQGRLLKDSIMKAWEILQDSQELEHVRPKLAPKALHLIHCQKKAVTFLKNYMAKFINHQNERVLGLTNGANLTQETLFFLQAYEMELQTKLDSFALNSGTAVYLSGDKSTTDEPIIAKNLDMSIDLSEHLLIRKSKPRDGYASLELTHSFMAGTYSGMNQHGLTIIQTPCYCTDMLSLKTVPLSILIQEALQTCRTTDEAITAITANHHRDIGGNLLITDAQKNTKVLEVSRTKHYVSPVNHPFTVLSNQYTSSEMQALQYNTDSTWGPKAMSGFAGESVYASSIKRKERLFNLIEQSTLLFDVETIQTLLADHNSQPMGDQNSVCRHGSPFSTQATIIFLPMSRTIQVSSGTSCVSDFSTHVL